MMVDSKIKVITVTSDPTNQGVHNLIGSLTKYNWSFQVIPCIWHGFGTKIIKTYEYLKEHPEIEHFIFCDANDVVVLGTEEEFIEKMDYFGLDCFICSAEKNLWPPILKPFIKAFGEDNKNGFNYLNSGLYYAPSKLFIQYVEEYPPFNEIDDQFWFNMLCIISEDDIDAIYLDTDQMLFNSHSFIKEGEYEYRDNRVFINGEKPVFIHGNGKSDMTKVLELLK